MRARTIRVNGTSVLRGAIVSFLAAVMLTAGLVPSRVLAVTGWDSANGTATVSTEKVREHTAQLFVGQADVGSQDVDITFDWGLNMLLDDATKGDFNDKLAVPCLLLSGAIEQEESHDEGRTEQILNDLGFDVTEPFIKGYNDVNKPALVCGYRKLDVGHETKNLFVVVVRGTSNLEKDTITDLIAVHDGFKRAAANTKDTLQGFMRDKVHLSPERLEQTKGDNIFLLTGHSLGGATINHLALDLGKYATDDHIFAYTFAAPMTTDQPDKRSNIHNLVNKTDWVPNINKTGTSRNGVDLPLGPNDVPGFEEAFKDLTGKEWKDQADYSTYGSSVLSISTIDALTGKPLRAIINRHVVETYMAFLMARRFADSQDKSQPKGQDKARGVASELNGGNWQWDLSSYYYADVYGGSDDELLLELKDARGSGYTLFIYSYEGGVRQLYTEGGYPDEWYDFHKATDAFLAHGGSHGSEWYFCRTFEDGLCASKTRTSSTYGGSDGPWTYSAHGVQCDQAAYDEVVEKLAKGEAIHVPGPASGEWKPLA